MGRCLASGRLIMSASEMPLLLELFVPWEGGMVGSSCGSMGASAGSFWGPWIDRFRSVLMGGRSTGLLYGRRRGEWAGVAIGVWSGVGDSESWEKVGDEGAVELGELGRERLACLEFL